MPRYRIGNPGLGLWYGGESGQSYRTYESGSDQEAWETGQALISRTWEPNSGYLLALEREHLFPNPKLLSGENMTIQEILEKHPGGYPVWVRVAVGIHGVPWKEESTCPSSP